MDYDDDIENEKKQEYFSVNLDNLSKDELDQYIHSIQILIH